MPSSQITPSAMFDALLIADPSFQPHWDAFQKDSRDEPEPPLYWALWRLADHMDAHLTAGREEPLNKIFEVVERWHVEGDSYVSEAATIGLLESLQGRGGDYRQWMRPETTRWWDKLNRFWDGGDKNALRSDP